MGIKHNPDAYNRAADQSGISNYEPHVYKMLMEIGSIIRSRFGHKSADTFIQWSEQVALTLPDENPHWTAYLDFFVLWAARLRRKDLTYESLWTANPRIFDLYTRMRKSILYWQGEIARTINYPLSVWDADVYRSEEFFYDPHLSGHANDPFIWVESIIRMNWFQCFWEKMLRISTEGELQTLHSAVLAQSSDPTFETCPLLPASKLRRTVWLEACDI